jgi:hypothetical protein
MYKTLIWIQSQVNSFSLLFRRGTRRPVQINTTSVITALLFTFNNGENVTSCEVERKSRIKKRRDYRKTNSKKETRSLRKSTRITSNAWMLMWLPRWPRMIIIYSSENTIRENNWAVDFNRGFIPRLTDYRKRGRILDNDIAFREKKI